ncbi:MAG: HAD-IA family hydrolase [Actinomycetota bacterium]|nr:HAD-IA family hydrolase [Actinomycetota bacterium]
MTSLPARRWKAVYFDAGETLLAPHPSFDELFSQVLAEHGHDVSPKRVRGALESIAPTFTEVIDRMGGAPWSTSKEASWRFWSNLYATALEELAIPDPSHELARDLYSKFTRYESYRLFPDAVPTLQAMREAGLVVGLISNFEEWLEGMLIEMEVAHLFDIMVISGKEGMEKPDPAIFRLALDRTGVAAGDSLYVGDHPRIDVEGARAVGMGAVLIDRRGRHVSFDGIRIQTLTELLDLMEAR